MAIRDTSVQDIPANPHAIARRRLRKPLAIAVVALAVLGLALWLGRSWLSGERSVSTERVRIAEVVRGDLVRDIASDGRVIAANSPSLYAIGAGTVSLKVVAGDVVKAGDVLAEIDSPELLSRLQQEQSTLASLQAEASRAALSAQLVRSNARKLLDQARIEQVAAKRELERYQRAYDGGAVAQMDVVRARDAVEKADIGLAHAGEDAGLQGSAAGLDARNRHAMAMRQDSLSPAYTQKWSDVLKVR